LPLSLVTGGLFALARLLAAVTPPTSPAQQPPADSGALGPGRAEWARSYADAAGRARSENKVVYVEFDTETCSDCKRFDTLLYPATDFEFLLLRMVPVKLRLGQDEASTLAARYHVGKAPSVLILSPGGALIFRLEGFDSPPSFYRHVHTSMADYDKLNVRMIHEPETLDDPKAELSLGAELYRRFDSEEAVARLERAARSPRADSETREQALAFLASAQLELNRVADSKASVDEILKSTKDPARREKAELFRAQVSLAEGKRAEARRRYQDFLKDHPGSKLRSEAETLLKGLGDS
jgi:tetratricopeptide (TPR) repeat protein